MLIEVVEFESSRQNFYTASFFRCEPIIDIHKCGFILGYSIKKEGKRDEKKRLHHSLFIGCQFCFYAQTTGNAATTKEPRWGFSGSIEMGGLRLSGEGFDLVRDEGYGTVSTESILALFSGGVDYRRPEVFDLALTFSYLAGGSFMWQNLFGDFSSEFSLYGDSLGIQVEIQPLFPWLHGFHPFIGGGWSLTNGLVDEIGDGFVRGSGPFIVGGLCIYKALGLYPYLPFSVDHESFFGLRISFYYRFPYAYGFRLDWDEFEENYFGPVDADTLRTFFEGHEFPSSSFAFSVGISMGYTPFSASKRR